MTDSLRTECAHMFRDVSRLSNSSTHFGWSDEKLLAEPWKALGIDSLTILEFVMEIENAYDVQLDEEDVNLCNNVGELIDLVVAARNGTRQQV
jgi:acyl carrier protein